MASCFPTLTATNMAERKCQLTFRCQVNRYSGIDNSDHLDALTGVGFAPRRERLGAIPRLMEERRLNRSSR